MEVKCEQNFVLNETMKLERTEFCLLGKEFRDASPAALVGKFGDLSKRSDRISVISVNLTGCEVIFQSRPRERPYKPPFRYPLTD